MIGKQIQLCDAIQAVRKQDNKDGMYQLIRTVHKVMKPDSGLIWSEVLEVLERCYNDSPEAN